MLQSSLSARDVDYLASHGIAVQEAKRQLALLRRPPPAARLVRPCVVGDGIRRLDGDQRQRFIAAGKAAALAGRVSKLVPASGAATRMFQAPLSLATRDDLNAESLRRLAEATENPKQAQEAQAVIDLLDRAESLPFFADLAHHLAERGLGSDLASRWERPQAVLSAMLHATEGLGYAKLPKGLIPFHRTPDEGSGRGHRTALEEQLAEAVAYTQDRTGRCQLHFTLSDEHSSAFKRHIQQAQARLAGSATFEISSSSQSSKTRTLALDGQGNLLRNADDNLYLHPGGHGSLLTNLQEFEGDLVVIKNIDNVVPQRSQGLTAEWKSALIGLASELQQRSFKLAAAIEGGAAGAAREAARFLATELGGPALDTLDERQIAAQLNRPLRVCGMVANTGEPGGGPFWVLDSAFGPAPRIGPQIVEKGQIDTAEPAQKKILEGATHFNPVDLICAPRDCHGEPFDLARFVDPNTAFVASKKLAGQPFQPLERPGLWNGAMAGWNTLFVEVPLATFAPVKTVLDLLRPEHQG